MELLIVILGCIVVAAIISGIFMMVVRNKLKSVRSERAACNCMRSGSFRTTNKCDVFLYNNIVRIPRAQNISVGGRR